jgi:thiamine biosynthesis lipoprotein
MGTLVEVGLHDADVPTTDPQGSERLFTEAFAVLATIEACMSRQRDDSDLVALNSAAPGVAVTVHPETAAVLAHARHLHAASGGAFDVSCGSARNGCGFDSDRARAWRTELSAVLSLDGIAKGYAVDRAVMTLQAHGAKAGWVNAGGDLRAFGNLELPVDVHLGARVRRIVLRNAALATSEFGRHRRYRGSGIRAPRGLRHTHGVSVRAAQCVIADALTKVMLVAGREAQALAGAFGADIVWQR